MDHYKILGLNKNATKAEIKEAFRDLAKKFHPDKHSHSSKLERDHANFRFKQASEAYEVLIDDRKRAHYNQGFQGGGGGGGFAGGRSANYGYGYNHSYYSARNESGYRPRYSSASASKWGIDIDVAFRYLTSRAFLLNLAFASVLLGGAVIIESSGEALWKMRNSGKSFEEAVESIEKKKSKKDTS